MNALIAGDIVFTATSHGANRFPPTLLLSGENVYKDAVCHVII
jgi:hypothetical protein